MQATPSSKAIRNKVFVCSNLQSKKLFLVVFELGNYCEKGKMSVLCYAVLPFQNAICIYEPRCEKSGLRGFRPGPTQIRL